MPPRVYGASAPGSPSRVARQTRAVTPVVHPAGASWTVRSNSRSTVDPRRTLRSKRRRIGADLPMVRSLLGARPMNSQPAFRRALLSVVFLSLLGLLACVGQESAPENV